MKGAALSAHQREDCWPAGLAGGTARADGLVHVFTGWGMPELRPLTMLPPLPAGCTPVAVPYAQHTPAQWRAHTQAEPACGGMVVAWSLGVRAALMAMAAGWLRPARMVWLAPAIAMDPAALQAFRETMARNPLQGWRRFRALVVHGAAAADRLPHLPAVRAPGRWDDWLAELAEPFPDPAALAASGTLWPPNTILHGTADAVVPHAGVQAWVGRAQQVGAPVTLHTLPSVAHGWVWEDGMQGCTENGS